MLRRRLIQGASLGAVALAAPSLVRAEEASTLRFVPAADLAVLDPVLTSAYVTRNHGFMVFDTLYGLDAQLRPQPQMVAGHVIEDDGLTWRFTLRNGLRFHDDTPVLARDVVASLRRWAVRDSFGIVLSSLTNEVAATSDNTFHIRLKRPFPPMLDGFAHCSTYLMPIMPERLASTPASTQVTEMIGSGPYRFIADERIPGARVGYCRFEDYQPRPEQPSFLAGAKRPLLERIEWRTLPDPATASSALRNNEVDWWEQPNLDLVPQLRKSRGVVTEVTDTNGFLAYLRLNHLHPPFDNPTIRRLVLSTARQTDFMTAVVGDENSMWHETGIFTPGTTMANDAGMSVTRGPVDYNRIKENLLAAGYRGEPVTMLAATDFPSVHALSEVAADMFRQMGFNLDYQALDWGTVVQRRISQEPPSRGGWSTHATLSTGYDNLSPAVNSSLNAVGRAGLLGWADSPALANGRLRWFEAANIAAQQSVCRDIQQAFLENVPYVPLGQFFQPTAYRDSLKGVAKGAMTIFHNVSKS